MAVGKDADSSLPAARELVRELGSTEREAKRCARRFLIFEQVLVNAISPKALAGFSI
jgi:hypothetical protein